MTEDVEMIEPLTRDRVDWLRHEFETLAWPRSPGYFAACFDQQERSEIVLFVARAGEDLLGYLKVVWQPDYPPFRESRIPEVQDLNVVPGQRRHGVASRLMDRAEALIATRSRTAGIGVGLHPGYAAAQRLYVLRGYVPDARPLTYDNVFVHENQTVPLDNELVMHLTKRLDGEK
jgi:GNAT superfamily N-acetyltransferase